VHQLKSLARSPHREDVAGIIRRLRLVEQVESLLEEERVSIERQTATGEQETVDT
jgi:hypothetical protein